MSSLLGWRIYYDNGTTFSSVDGTWNEAPGDGVQVVVEYYDDESREVHLARDYYIFDEGKTYGTNRLEPWLHKHNIVKFGRWSANGSFAQLVKRAKADNAPT